jgi:putative transposase
MPTPLISVQLIPLRSLAAVTAAQCEALRREAGRCWSKLVALHVASRGGAWLSERELKALTKGGRFRLHSQSVQALAETLIANVDTARTNRKREQAARGEPLTRYPYREKPYQTVTWKGQALRLEGGRLILPNGRGQADLVLPLPERFHGADIRQAELLWRADRYELALTIATRPPEKSITSAVPGQSAGVDLGEINVAALCTADGQALVISGRLLRHVKQLRNKRQATYQKRLARCQKGSRRWKRLRQQQARAAAKLYRQQRNLLHQASRKAVAFAQQHGVSELAVGDVRDIADGVDKGRHSNQKLSQWPHGQFRRYLEEKAARLGMRVSLTDEAYSTRTCACCGHRHHSAPRGRVMRCSGCGVTVHRDANGAANICSRQVFGRFGHVQVRTLMHRRAAAVRAPTRANVAGSKRPVAPPGDGMPPEAPRL